jgi:hypothetical protein
VGIWGQIVDALSTPAATLVAGALGVWATLRAVRVGERHQRERERTAELRVAHAEFATLAALTINKTMESDFYVRVLYTKVGPDLQPLEGQEDEVPTLKARAQMIDTELGKKKKQLEAPYLKVRLLDRKRDQRDKLKTLYENILYWKPGGKDRPVIDPDENPVEALLEPTTMESELYDELHVWMDEQAERQDI